MAGEWGHLHPFRRINPGVGGENLKTKFDARDLALGSIFTSLYVGINVAQMLTPAGNPSVFGPIQLRVADCLIALAALFGLPLIFGVSVGCAVVNAFGGIGVVDIVFGSIANLIAANVIMLLRKRALLACILGALPIGIIVGGGYLWMFFPPPSEFNFLPAWAAMALSISISSLIAVAGVGYILLKTLTKPAIIDSLKSHGLKVLTIE